MKKHKPEWIIEYQNIFGEWELWNETTLFNSRTFLPVFFSKDAAICCCTTIRQQAEWKKKPFRARKISVIKLKDSVQCE